jgi:Peptidase S46
MREELGPDDEWVKRLLGKRSPEEVAQELVAGTAMADRALRLKLFEGGKDALAQVQDDSMMKLVALLEPESRKQRKHYEDDIQSRERKNGELIAKARIATEGMNGYPDATFAPRLSYGAVRGWEHAGRKVEPFTPLGGAFERATGREPFALPQTWLKARDKVRATTPLNLASDNDIIGGNSGSPLFNKELEIVGLVFDGNIESLGGEYFFDESVNRTVSVHSEGMLEALDRIYDAQRVVEEIRPRGTHPSGMK